MRGLSPRIPPAGKLLEYAVIGVLIAGTAWLGKLTYHNTVEHSQTVQTRAVAPLEIPGASLDGTMTSLAVEGRQRALMLLVLSTECPFCEQNMPAWKRLVTELAAQADTGPEVVVLSVSPPEATRAFLAAHGVGARVVIVDRSVLRLLGLRGYPVTIAVQPGSRAMTAWSGVLNEADHRTLMVWAASTRAATATSLDASIRTTPNI